MLGTVDCSVGRGPRSRSVANATLSSLQKLPSKSEATTDDIAEDFRLRVAGERVQADLVQRVDHDRTLFTQRRGLLQRQARDPLLNGIEVTEHPLDLGSEQGGSPPAFAAVIIPFEEGIESVQRKTPVSIDQ